MVEGEQRSKSNQQRDGKDNMANPEVEMCIKTNRNVYANWYLFQAPIWSLIMQIKAKMKGGIIIVKAVGSTMAVGSTQ